MKSKRVLRTLKFLTILAMAAMFHPGWAMESADEALIKISYLAKFPKFVEWPAETPSNGEVAFNFCVLGDEEVNAISAALSGQSIKTEPVKVIDVKRRNSMNECMALYIASSEAWRVREIIQQLQAKPILSISEIEGFASQGGIIELVKQDERLKFEINEKAAVRAGLRISAQLARLAVKIH